LGDWYSRSELEKRGGSRKTEITDGKKKRTGFKDERKNKKALVVEGFWERKRYRGPERKTERERTLEESGCQRVVRSIQVKNPRAQSWGFCGRGKEQGEKKEGLCPGKRNLRRNPYFTDKRPAGKVKGLGKCCKGTQ